MYITREGSAQTSSKYERVLDVYGVTLQAESASPESYAFTNWFSKLDWANLSLDFLPDRLHSSVRLSQTRLFAGRYNLLIFRFITALFISAIMPGTVIFGTLIIRPPCEILYQVERLNSKSSRTTPHLWITQYASVLQGKRCEKCSKSIDILLVYVIM